MDYLKTSNTMHTINNTRYTGLPLKISTLERVELEQVVLFHEGQIHTDINPRDIALQMLYIIFGYKKWNES